MTTERAAGLREWWESLTPEDQWEAFVTEKSNADNLAAPAPAGLREAHERLDALFGSHDYDGTFHIDCLVCAALAATPANPSGLREAAWCGDRNPHRSHQGPPRCKGVSYREAGILRAALAATEPGLDVERERSNWPEWFSPDMAKGWIAAWDRVDGLIAATEPGLDG